MKKKTLMTAASITIATWLDELHDLRRKILRNIRGAPRSRRTISKENKCSERNDVTDGQTWSWEQAVKTSTEKPPV